MSDSTDTVEKQHPALERLPRDFTLAEGARSGGLWMGAASLGTQALQFLVSIAMARLGLDRPANPARPRSQTRSRPLR